MKDNDTARDPLKVKITLVINLNRSYRMLRKLLNESSGTTQNYFTMRSTTNFRLKRRVFFQMHVEIDECVFKTSEQNTCLYQFCVMPIKAFYTK